jgi:hypothetical protein
MKIVTIGFSKSIKPFAPGSAAIRWYMGTPYSHVYLKFEAPNLERTLIYEAVGSGVRFIGADRWATHAQEVDSFKLEITDEAYKQIMQYCVDNAGIDYGLIQNFGILIASAFNMDKNPSKEGENCSEAIGGMLELIGYIINKDLNLLTPRDIHNILTTQGLQVLAREVQDPSQKQ